MMKEEEKLKEGQLQAVLSQKLAQSLTAAASEVLGTDREKFSKYFQVYSCTFDGRPGMAIVEQVTGNEHKLAISNEALLKDSDASYYKEIRRLAILISPYIPEEEKKIPKDEWPEPKWEEPESEKQKGD